MGLVMFEVVLVPGIVALVFIFPTVWWHVSYRYARQKVFRLLEKGCMDSLAIYTFPFPHVVVRDHSVLEEAQRDPKRKMETWIKEDGTTQLIPVFGALEKTFH